MGGATLLVNFADCPTDTQLYRCLFDDPIFRSWENGTHRLHLFLDSLDESHMGVGTMAKLLARELRRYPAERLFLRIACRSADWLETSLGEPLQQHWGKQNVSIFELAPLRRADVAIAATENDLDLDIFLQAIDHADAVPFAIKPITLRFLLNLFQHEERFPATQSQLYEAGCLQLCEEQNPYRREAQQLGNYTAEQRLTAAERIAAVTIFAHRTAIWTDVVRGDILDEAKDVTIRMLANENGDDQLFAEPAIREALFSTALFSSRGPHRLGWTHQTYAEYLAARHLVRHNLAFPQIMSLISHRDGSGSKIVPQLRDVAAWLANMRPDIFDAILQHDPQVLLRSDLASVPPEQRAIIVEAILRLFDTDQVRVNAATAIERIGDTNAKHYLQSLLAIDANDPEDELRGIALRALWPEQISVEELFEAITPPKRENLLGIYWMFLAQHLTPFLQTTDLPIALRWVESQQEVGAWRISQTVVGVIMQFAWEHLEQPGVLDAFASAALTHMRRYDNTFGDALRERNAHNEAWKQEYYRDQVKRRRVVERMLPDLAADPGEAIWLIRARPALVISSDIAWLVEMLQVTPELLEQEVVAVIIERLFNWNDHQFVDIVYATIQHSPVLARRCGQFFEPVILGSLAAEQARETYLLDQLQAQLDEAEIAQHELPAQHISESLATIEAGQTINWWKLNEAMRFDAYGMAAASQYEADLTRLPGWQSSDIDTRGRIQQAAARYVLEHEAHPEQWLGQDRMTLSALAGYRALRLIQDIQPDLLNTFPVEVWQRWASIIVIYPTQAVQESEEPHQRIVHIAYQRAPEAILTYLNYQIDYEDTHDGYLQFLRKFDYCWDDRLVELLLSKLYAPLKLRSMEAILSGLLAHGIEQAKQFTYTLVALPIPQDEVSYARATTVARLLFTYTADAAWAHLWPVIQADLEFGRAVMTSIAGTLSWGIAGHNARLTEAQLAELYIWLARQFPHHEDPHIDVAHQVQERERVASSF
jgi:hypothetical protein